MILKNVGKVYDERLQEEALIDISITLPNKGLIFILGKSGSGKSTLLNILGGIDRPTSGEILLGNIRLDKLSDKELASYRNSYCSFIFQDYNLIDSLNVYENVKLALDLNNNKKDIVTKYLNEVGLFNYENKLISSCSGGECQRIAIARALIKNPKMILCDEPTAALDSKNGNLIMNILKNLAQNRLIVVVTHNENYAKNYGDGIIKLQDGKIIANNISLKNHDEDNIKLYESKLNLSTKIKIGSLAIKKHPVRFIANIFLLTLSFLLLLFSLQILTIDSNKSFLKTIKNNDYQYVTINKKYNDMNVNLNSKDMNYLDQSLKVKSMAIVEDELSLNNVNYNSDLYYYNVIPRGYTYTYVIDKQGFDITGKLPQDYNEIAISKYLNDIIVFNGLNETKIDTVLGQYLQINNTMYMVCGIVDTSFTEKYDLLKSKNDEALAKQYANYLKHDIASLIIFSDKLETNLIDLENNYLLINNNVTTASSKIACLEEYYQYTLISKTDGIVIPVGLYVSILNDYIYNNYFNNEHYYTYFQLLKAIMDNSNYSNYYEAIVNNLQYFLPTFNALTGSSIRKDLSYKVVGIYEGNDNTILLTKSEYDSLYKNIGGQFNSILINKNDINGLDNLINSDSYIFEQEIKNSINNLEDFLSKLNIPIVVISIVFLIMAFGLYFVYINKNLIDKSNTMAILKMLGCSNNDIYKIIFISVIPIIILTAFSSSLLNIFLYNYFSDLLLIIFSINISSNYLIYLINIIVLILFAVVAMAITIKKINKMSLIDVFHYE